jgi:hypothetical protein
VLLIACVVTFVFAQLNGYTLRTNGNADAAFHIRYLNQFESHSAVAYHGFVSFYAVCILLKDVFALSLPTAHFVALAFGLFVVIAAVGTVWKGVCAEQQGSARLASCMAFILLSVGLILPLYNQFFLQGGYVHAFGTVTYPLLISLYVYSGSVLWRIVSLIVGLACLRFMYGLNLPDYSLACASVVAMELLGTCSRWIKLILLGVVAVFLFSAWVSFQKLVPMAGQSGAGTPYSLYTVWCLYGVGVALAIGELSLRRGKAQETVYGRALSITTALVAGALLVQLTYVFSGKRLLYYMLKHPLYPLMALLLLCLVIVAQNAKWGMGKGGARSRGMVAGALLLCSALALTLRPILADTFIKPSYGFARHDEFAAIGSVLTATGRRFGGYLAPSWPAAHYINEAFGRPMGLRSFKSASLDMSPDSCVFWPTGIRREDLRRVHRSLRGDLDSVLNALDARFDTVMLAAPDSKLVGAFPELRMRFLCSEG